MALNKKGFNPHLTGYGLEVAGLFSESKGSRIVSILILLDTGWKAYDRSYVAPRYSVR